MLRLRLPALTVQGEHFLFKDAFLTNYNLYILLIYTSSFSFHFILSYFLYLLWFSSSLFFYLDSIPQNPDVLLQRWGRSLRRTADADKVGLLALPCGDPYEPDEDQDAEWARLGLEAAPKRDKRAELDAGFDLACRLAECAASQQRFTGTRVCRRHAEGQSWSLTRKSAICPQSSSCMHACV